MVQDRERNERGLLDIIYECKVRPLVVEAYCTSCKVHPFSHTKVFHIQKAEPSILREAQPFSVWPYVVAVCISVDCNNMDGSLTKDRRPFLLVLYLVDKKLILMTVGFKVLLPSHVATMSSALKDGARGCTGSEGPTLFLG